MQQIPHSESVVSVVKLSASQFASATNDGTVKIFDLVAAKSNFICIRTIQAHVKSNINCMVRLSESTLVTCGQQDALVKIWNFQTGNLVKSIDAFSVPILHAVKLSPSTLVACQVGKTDVSIIDLNDEVFIQVYTICTLLTL